MKYIRRFWPVTYIIWVLVLVMVMMTLFTRAVADRDKLVLIHVILTLFSAGVCAFANERIRQDVRAFLGDVWKQLSPSQRNELSDIPMPVAVIGHKGEIVWYNDSFENELLRGEPHIGENIRTLNANFDTAKLHMSKSFHLRWEDKWMDCRVTSFNGGNGRYVVYFSDITELKDMEERYLESRPTVMLVVFDNEDELLKVRESERMRVIAAVDGIINKWAGGISGICWADARDKSLIVLEETEAKKLIDARFSILEEARSIVAEDGTPVTLSIGVGRGGKNIEECEAWALGALDMALGRGGDQAVVRSEDGYSFFGGVTNTSERQSRVRIRMLGSALSELIAKSDNCIIMGHRYSDLDSVGAAIGMAGIVRASGREAFIAVDKETSMAQPLINYYSKSSGNQKLFLSTYDALDRMREGTLLLIVDVHAATLLDNRTLYDNAKNVVIIDHHRLTVDHIENAKLLIHEPYASSACEIVSELAAYGAERAIGRFEAEALLAGIMLDTKNYVLRTGVRTFEASAFLRRRGADTVEVRKLFSESLDTYVERLNVVSSAKVHSGCAISQARSGIENARMISSQAADDMLSITGVNASFVLFEADGAVNISARSLGRVNVQLIMERLGGGGHLTMAATQIKGKTLQQAEAMLKAAIDNKPHIEKGAAD